MINYKRIVMLIFCAAVGAVLLYLGVSGAVDSFWSGMGSGVLTVSVLRVIRTYRFHKDDTYREKMETEVNDERNQFLRNKAWAWAGSVCVVGMAVLVIVLKVMGQDLLSVAAGFAICILLILYWVSFLVLRKKY